MKRSAFIASLLGFVGIGRAQQWAQCVRSTENRFFCTDEMKPKLNNQCPVCGEMAKPFKKPQEWDYYPSGYSEVKNGKREPINLTRCKRCNAAFWQDVEGE